MTTEEWVESAAGSAVSETERLQGGWTSEMRRMRLADGRSVVLRLLEPTAIPAAQLLGVDPEGRQYWFLLDASAYAPHARKVAEPWRGLGRTDLTPQLLQT